MSRGGEFGGKICARNWRWGREEGEAAPAGGLLGMGARGLRARGLRARGLRER